MIIYTKGGTNKANDETEGGVPTKGDSLSLEELMSNTTNVQVAKSMPTQSSTI